MLDILAEPQRTNYDLHFQIAGVPVRVHPLYWLTTVLLGINALKLGPIYLLLWIIASFVSILIHELGHAVMIRRFGFRPRIVLHAMGGLAIYNPNEQLGYDPYAVFGEEYAKIKDHQPQVLISLAGPMAGFLFAGLLAILIWVFQGRVEFSLSWQTIIDVRLSQIATDPMRALLQYLFYINIYWGLLNLLPIFPLDGGQIARELICARQGQQGLIPAQQLAIATAVAMVVVAVVFWPEENKFFGAVMFGLLAFQNYQIFKLLKLHGTDVFDAGGHQQRRGPREPWESDDDDDRGW